MFYEEILFEYLDPVIRRLDDNLQKQFGGEFSSKIEVSKGAGLKWYTVLVKKRFFIRTKQLVLMANLQYFFDYFSGEASTGFNSMKVYFPKALSGKYQAAQIVVGITAPGKGLNAECNKRLSRILIMTFIQEFKSALEKVKPEIGLQKRDVKVYIRIEYSGGSKPVTYEYNI